MSFEHVENEMVLSQSVVNTTLTMCLSERTLCLSQSCILFRPFSSTLRPDLCFHHNLVNLSTGLSPSHSPAGGDTVAMETGCDHHPSGGLGPAGGRERGGVHRLEERTRGPERAGH